MTALPENISSRDVASGRYFAAPFLRINSTIQSYLPLRIQAGDGQKQQSHSRRQQGRCLLGYLALLGLAFMLGLEAHTGGTGEAMALGITFPGAGFLGWASPGQFLPALGLFAASLALFVTALILWFATGNVIGPPVVWLALAALAGDPEIVGLAPVPVTAGWSWLIGPGVLLIGVLAWLQAGQRVAQPEPDIARCFAETIEPRQEHDELSHDDIQRMRLLLDRALQPVSRFDGFEWRDQFQTAAVRYQVNFMSYALTMAQRHHTPAASGYFAQAQRNLLTKIGDRRLWGYWGLENAWGNLRLDTDPVAHQNIMYSGFTALQMAIGGGESLELHRGEKLRGEYRLHKIAALLERQYRASRYGLLACEPNWIYPLCNLITMAGIKASDARLGTDLWPQLAAPFLASLKREATRSDGSFIAFRSALTGIAPPAPGGIVMQAFPCLFLNALSPELVQEHWHRVRGRLEHGSWKRLFWPVDVGNYGFSRASSYAATAAAAVEMGDTGIAEECLRRLEEECPSREEGGVIHRDRASLWAHALEMLARSNRANGLRHLVGHMGVDIGPRLVSAPYPDVLVARAIAEGCNLKLVLHPGRAPTVSLIELGGLLPERHYHTGHSEQPYLKADRDGRGLLRLSLKGRTGLSIKPVV